MKTLLIPIVLLALLTSSCRSQQHVTAPDVTHTATIQTNSLEGEWKLSNLNGESIPLGDGGAYLNFDLEANRFYGNAGCNSFSGELELDGDTMKLGMIMATKKYCPNNQLEGKLLRILGQATFKFNQIAQELILTNETNKLVLTKSD